MRATFDRNLIHSADACFLVMARVGYARAQLKTLSSMSAREAWNAWVRKIASSKVCVDLDTV